MALPVLIEHVAEPHVGDAGAAQASEASERRAVAADTQQDLEQVAAALEHGTVMRGAHADEAAQAGAPAVPRLLGDVARASGHETSHAVAHDRDLLDGG